jgi:hypothetical protein
MTTQATPKEQDYPLSPVPMDQRKSVWSMGLVLLGFTFFTATMWAGGSVGVAFDFSTMLLILAAGNLLLGTYAAVLGYIAAETGLNTALMSRFTFGEIGSKLSDIILGFTQIGWYAWGTATMAILLVKLTGLPESLTTPLMVVFGFGFCIRFYWLPWPGVAVTHCRSRDDHSGRRQYDHRHLRCRWPFRLAGHYPNRQHDHRRCHHSGVRNLCQRRHPGN